MGLTGLSAEFLKSALCGMTEIEQCNQGYEVTLPQAYASGHAVVVVATREGDGFLIHDNSYAAMLLDQSGTIRSPSLISAVSEGVRHYGCELDAMRVVRRCKTADEVALSAVLVGCASRLIADQSLKAERLPIFDFKQKLLGKVTEIVGSKRVRTNEQVIGHLGSKYKVAAVVLDSKASRPLAFVEGVNDQDAVARKFKEFYDIRANSSYDGIDLVAVIDDEKEIPPGDVLLMQEVGNIVRFRDAAVRFEAWNGLQ
jgi:hypothetical protein